ncbi:hypothetical protein L7F22_008682 [Adiantum nelumboides]|nr:hypothetical protein [Adiantum nelumboides]
MQLALSGPSFRSTLLPYSPLAMSSSVDGPNNSTSVGVNLQQMWTQPLTALEDGFNTSNHVLHKSTTEENNGQVEAENGRVDDVVVRNPQESPSWRCKPKQPANAQKQITAKARRQKLADMESTFRIIGPLRISG